MKGRLEGHPGGHSLRLFDSFKHDALPKPPLADRGPAEAEPAEEPGEHECAGPQDIHPVAVHAGHAPPAPLSLDEKQFAERLDVDGGELQPVQRASGCAGGDHQPGERLHGSAGGHAGGGPERVARQRVHEGLDVCLDPCPLGPGHRVVADEPADQPGGQVQGQGRLRPHFQCQHR